MFKVFVHLDNQHAPSFVSIIVVFCGWIQGDPGGYGTSPFHCTHVSDMSYIYTILHTSGRRSCAIGTMAKDKDNEREKERKRNNMCDSLHRIASLYSTHPSSAIYRCP